MILALALSAPVFADPPAPGSISSPDGITPRPGHLANRIPLPGAKGVTGGRDADPGEFPDVAGIIFRDGYVECTGVLVAPDVVLTAGHCAEGIRSVLLGSSDWNSDEGETIGVTDIYEYPDSWNTYDVTALVLAHPSTVPPRVIANDCIEEDIVDGAPVETVGFGAIDAAGNRYISRLQVGETVITDADCSHTDWGCNPSVTPNGEIGAGENGVDACYGDSGGPLLLPTARGTYVVGIVSRGWDFAMECGDGGVWVRPDAPTQFDWIQETTGRTLARPVCGEPLVPTAEAIYLTKNSIGTTVVSANDPDGNDGLTYAILTPPTNGAASVDADGVVTYHPETDWKGEESIAVRVTDPQGLTGDVTIAVKVLTKGQFRRATHAGGCDSSGAGGAGLFGLLLLAFATRRRR
jgi:uncharacterized protein (TIGR03382 family)